MMNPYNKLSTSDEPKGMHSYSHLTNLLAITKWYNSEVPTFSYAPGYKTGHTLLYKGQGFQ